MCGYVCCNCGKCKGKSNFAKSAGTCFSCGTANDPAVQVCSVCGTTLIAPPGQSGYGTQFKKRST